MNALPGRGSASYGRLLPLFGARGSEHPCATCSQECPNARATRRGSASLYAAEAPGCGHSRQGSSSSRFRKIRTRSLALPLILTDAVHSFPQSPGGVRCSVNGPAYRPAGTSPGPIPEALLAEKSSAFERIISYPSSWTATSRVGEAARA